jgi:Na+-transporting NADH:ubiquinone oxidoreductase subunit C
VSNKESAKKTIIVSLALCVVCSIVVSTAAVLLKPAQVANKSLDFKRNILQAAGLLDPAQDVVTQFSQVTTKIVDLDAGKFTDQFDIEKYDQRKASSDASLSTVLSGDEDIAKIARRVNFAKIYLIENENGIDKVILPIKGYGLWSTLYGFVALESDLNTIVGVGFYEHGETPGLGGEVDNPSWKALWVGKKVFADNGSLAVEVVKGKVNPQGASAQHQVDGLSGATLTSRGVSNLMRFWLGEGAYAGFLQNLKNGEA